MGVVRRQSVISTVFIFAGFIIGAINIFFFFGNEKYFTASQFGLTRLLPEITMIFAASCSLGAGIGLIKFYSFHDAYLQKNKNDLPILGLGACLIGCLLFALLFPLCKDFFVRKFSQRSALFVDYYHLLYPYVIGMTFFSFFEVCFWALKQTVLPNLLKELAFRLLNLLLILLLVFNVIDFDRFIIAYAFIYPAMALLLFAKLVKKDFFVVTSISSVTKRLAKKILLFTSFVFTGAILHITAVVLNYIIIASKSTNGLADVAVFTIAIYLVTLMDIPLRSMTGIATALITQAWREKDLKKIDELYRKTALTLLIAGAFILGVILLNANNIATFLGKTYSGIYGIILILGISKLIDLGAGLNSQILIGSKYWKIDFYTQFVLVVLMFVLQFYLIEFLGLIGSAYATLISLAVYNLMRFLYIKKLFNLQPFTSKNLIALLVSVLVFLLVWIIPFLGNIYLDSVIKTFIFSVTFCFVFYKMNISQDVTTALEIYIYKALNFLGVKKN
jgi:O-antigen/teichoic acid export membrane protein